MSSQLFILGAEQILVIPLTVAPPVSVAEMDVRPEASLPQLELDGDGKRTWRDDYILVANLLKQELNAKKLFEKEKHN